MSKREQLRAKRQNAETKRLIWSGLGVFAVIALISLVVALNSQNNNVPPTPGAPRPFPTLASETNSDRPLSPEAVELDALIRDHSVNINDINVLNDIAAKVGKLHAATKLPSEKGGANPDIKFVSEAEMIAAIDEDRRLNGDNRPTLPQDVARRLAIFAPFRNQILINTPFFVQFVTDLRNSNPSSDLNIMVALQLSMEMHELTHPGVRVDHSFSRSISMTVQNYRIDFTRVISDSVLTGTATRLASATAPGSDTIDVKLNVEEAITELVARHRVTETGLPFLKFSYLEGSGLLGAATVRAGISPEDLDKYAHQVDGFPFENFLRTLGRLKGSATESLWTEEELLAHGERLFVVISWITVHPEDLQELRPILDEYGLGDVISSLPQYYPMMAGAQLQLLGEDAANQIAY